ncbi:MAG: CxxC-x17-CxxC domain-containing protein [Minisyncoccia bacterium]
MNKFKKPYGNRTSSNRPSYDPARARTTSPRDARTYRSARSGGEAFQKFDAVCSNCGKKCQVPFRPDGEKPVYCKDCFDMPRKAMTGKKKFSTSPAASFSNSANFGSTAPTASAAGGKSIADLTRQIAAMNTKIDTMLKILQEGGTDEE